MTTSVMGSSSESSFHRNAAMTVGTQRHQFKTECADADASPRRSIDRLVRCRALLQPVGDAGPDLTLCFGTSHHADMSRRRRFDVMNRQGPRERQSAAGRHDAVLCRDERESWYRHCPRIDDVTADTPVACCGAVVAIPALQAVAPAPMPIAHPCNSQPG